jgi:cation transporter-like permease
MWDTALDRGIIMSASTRTVRRARRADGWAAAVTFLAVLTSTFIVGPPECVSTVTTNAAGVSTSGPLVCPLSAVLPLVLLGVFVVAWIATVAWAAARRRSGVEPDSTEVPMFPQGF